MVELRRLLLLLTGALLLAPGCAYRYYAGDLEPLDELVQGENRSVADDGTVTFTQGRLEISLRPMTDEELNRQFSAYADEGAYTRNPYTFANSTVFRTNETPQRFTVFRLRIENYEYPKVYVDPTQIYLTTANGRKYYVLTYEQLRVYHRRYAQGGGGGDSPGVPGNTFNAYRERLAVLRRTMLPNEQIFSAQESQGYIVFEPLAADVGRITVHIPNVAVRFDYRDVPVEMVDVTMKFEREIGRIYPDGRLELTRK
jgi:hypothetical protein